MSTPAILSKDPNTVADWEWDDKYDFPRDLVGYGEQSFNPKWPKGAKIAVSFVINYEEVCVDFHSHSTFACNIKPEKPKYGLVIGQ